MLTSLLLLGCVRGTSPPVTSAVGVSDARGHLALPHVDDVACGAEGCRVLAAGTLYSLPGLTPLGVAGTLAAFDSLRVEGESWWVSGACDPGPRCEALLDAAGTPGAGARTTFTLPPLEEDQGSLAEAGARFAEAWNRGIAGEWRSAFFRVIVGPGGGRITWIRGLDGAGQLVRAGAGSRTVRLGSATGAVSYPAWLALHPTGLEAYLVAWPSPVVRAFDPASLDQRWSLPVEGAAQGLFVDPGGRWLVVGVGPAQTDRLVDWDTLPPQPEAAAEPTSDEVLRAVERPAMTATLVIDLATHDVAARADGRFRRFIPDAARPILATDREIVYLDPGALPS